MIWRYDLGKCPVSREDRGEFMNPSARPSDLTRLLSITEACRPDMHEPDEQGLKARVIGDHLDNAFGEHIDEKMIAGGFQEFVVVLERIYDGKIVTEKFNLANLIALARVAPQDHTP